jgi:hypothetical protein
LRARTWVRFARSEPARSTKWNLEVMAEQHEAPALCSGTPPAPSESTGLAISTSSTICSIVTVKMACDRDDTAFIDVLPTLRQMVPFSRHCSMASQEVTCSSLAPTTCVFHVSEGLVDGAFQRAVATCMLPFTFSLKVMAFAFPFIVG